METFALDECFRDGYLGAMEFEHPIKKFRKERGLTLDDFGAIVGAQKAAVSKWERGEGPSPAMAVVIEDRTDGAIPRWKLRPDLWDAPTLAESAQ